ncbi:MAG: flavodoxin domain-containing protein [Pelolinea sp.]|nr:flavodoxin domain-containing protein [Pelolinea sp.]
MANPRLVSRRKFLKIAGGALGAGVVACGGATFFGLRTPSSVHFLEESFCEGQSKRILVAYASKCGATAEISGAITEALCASGLSAELKRAAHVTSLEGYQGVVLGTAIYMGNPLKEAIKFVEEFGSQMAGIPFALFDVCLTMKEVTPENEKAALDYLKPISDRVSPIKTVAFAGRIDYATLPPLYRMFAQADKEGILAEGDFRDWTAISTWAKDLGVVLADYS